MAGSPTLDTLPTPTIVLLGDCSMLVRFATTLGDAANQAAIALAGALDREAIAGVMEVVPNLVSVLLRYDPLVTTPGAIAGELRLRLGGAPTEPARLSTWTIPTMFDGPDLAAVAAALGMSAADFVAMHNASPLRVLATGFAPGFVYCGLHPEGMIVPRCPTVRPLVPAGSVLFAAGQTAIAATDMPTGWSVIGRTNFSNFDPLAEQPTRLMAGDAIKFQAVS